MNQTSTLDNYIHTLPTVGLADDELRRLCSAIRAAATLSGGEGEFEEATLRAARQAEGIIVQANLRLVVTFAQRYRSSGLPLDDLVQAGNMGLLSAARRFDERKGFQFSTYAYHWITAAITQTLRDSKNIIRLPRGLDAELGRHHSGHTPFDHNRIKWLENLSSVSSLDRSNADGERIHDPESADHPDDDALLSLLASDLGSALAILDPRSQELLVLRYGLNGERPWKVMHLAERYGMTRERVRQIHNAALEQLRNDAKVSNMRCWLT